MHYEQNAVRLIYAFAKSKGNVAMVAVLKKLLAMLPNELNIEPLSEIDKDAMCSICLKGGRELGSLQYSFDHNTRTDDSLHDRWMNKCGDMNSTCPQCRSKLKLESNNDNPLKSTSDSDYNAEVYYALFSDDSD